MRSQMSRLHIGYRFQRLLWRRGSGSLGRTGMTGVGLEGDVGWFSTYTHDSGVDCGHKNSCANGGSGMEDCGLRSIHEGGII